MTNDTTRVDEEDVSRDPIIAAIEAYHAGNTAYAAHPIVKASKSTDEEYETAIAETYGPADEVLKAWKAPAVTFAGAVAALKLARYEMVDNNNSSSDVADRMIDAALGFFAGGGADPVVAIAQRYADLEQRYQDMEAASGLARKEKRTSSEIYFEAAERDAYDALCAIRDTIPHSKATSLLGAIVHVNHALTAFAFLLDELPEQVETYEVKRLSRAIEKCLHSAIGAVETRAGIQLEDALHPDTCNRRMNPWVPVEQRSPDYAKAVQV